MKTFDVIIVGGGVVGCMTARVLSKFNLSIALIEKEEDIGMGASSANSAIIHAGHDPVPGTLKAEMNRLANPMWDVLSDELSIPFKRSGAYVVALGQDELGCLNPLEERGRVNGIRVERISREEMLKLEPLINPMVSGALFTPTAGMADPFAACLAPLENAVVNGVELMTDTSFKGFIVEGGKLTGIHTSRGDFGCRWVVNAAGTYSDDIMHLAGDAPDFEIKPRKGEYYILDKTEIQTNNILFPVPTGTSKGILVLGSTHGNVLVGPNSVNEESKDNSAVSRAGLEEIWSSAAKLVPSISPRSIIAVFSGLRATGNSPCRNPQVDYGHDFVIELSEHLHGVIHLAGIESPGLTAAPAIAQRVVELMKDAGEKLTEKKEWNPIRKPRPRFNHLSCAEQVALVSQDDRYGRIVCRCEMITEGEIVAEIHSPIPARTYDGIKRRTWLGTGRCLGSFDMPRVVSILSRELGIPVTEVTKKGRGSEFLLRSTKDVEAK
jgi:glycerol-3-phosphate dehydrogenase